MTLGPGPLLAVAILALSGLAACGGSDGSGDPSPPPTSRTVSVDEGTRFVAPWGNDTAVGSKEAPWATITHAVAEAPNGATIVVADGTYAESIQVNRSGTAETPLMIQAAPGARPVIAAAGATAIEVGNGSAFVEIDGLTFERATGESSTNIYVSGDAHDITFRACQSRRSARQGFFSERTTRNITVSGCAFTDNGGSGPDNLDHNLYVEGTGHTIVNNVIVGAKNGYGIQIYPVAKDTRIVNNTIVGNRSGVIIGADEAGATSGVVVVNNIIARSQRTGISSYWGDETTGTGNVAENNVLFQNRQGNLDRGGKGVTFRANTIGNPMFVDLATRDFRLQPGSAADGKALPAATPETDFSGSARPGSGADAGAFES